MYPTPKMVRQAARASMSLQAKADRRAKLRTETGVTPSPEALHALKPRRKPLTKRVGYTKDAFPWGLAWWEGRT